MKDDHRSRTQLCAVAKRKPEKIQACTTGFEPLTSAIPVQRSVNLAVAVISAINFIEE